MPNIIRIQNGGTEVGILPERGGRVVHLSRNGGENILWGNPNLYDAKIEPQLWSPEWTDKDSFIPLGGAEVWLSPQKMWWKQQNRFSEKVDCPMLWPPDPYIIYGECKYPHTKKAITLTGEKSKISGVQIVQGIRVDKRGIVHHKVTATNISNKPVEWGLWFITRVPGFSKSFVPTDDEVVVTDPFHPERQGRAEFEVKDGFFSFAPEKIDTEKWKESMGKAISLQ